MGRSRTGMHFFPSSSHTHCIGFNWLFHCLYLFIFLSSALSHALSHVSVFFWMFSLVSFTQLLSVNPSLFRQRHCVCARSWHGSHASIWKCSGDDIEHMWPQLAGWRRRGDHTMSLVAVRMPALQCKGGERRIRTDIIRLRKEEKNEVALSTFSALM